MNSDSDRDLLLISVFTFFTVILWISFELIKTIKTTTVTSSVQQIIVPLSPDIDADTMKKLSTRKNYE